MATLIGAGAHADDIYAMIGATGLRPWVRIAHHDQFVGPDHQVIIGVNDPWLRAYISDAIKVLDLSWVHPCAVLYHDVEIGPGSHVNYAAHAVRTEIGFHCTISPAVTICGDVTIGDRCLVGAGATICDRVTIGSDVTIGAGTIVLPESVIPDGTTWVGNPARCLR